VGGPSPLLFFRRRAMATIVLRQTKGSALTFQEGDDNFQNLNTDKVELDDLSVSQETASGNGTLSYNNTTGEFTYTPPDLSSYLTDYTVTEGDVTAHQAALSITESQISDLGSYLTAETNDLSSAVTWANVPDANITESSVTQHEAALSITESQISDLQSYLTSETFTEVSQDTTPELGGELVCAGNTISNPVLEDLGSTDTPTITVSNGNVQTVTISSGLTLPAFSDAATGQSVTLIVSGSGTASGTAAYRFAGGNKTLTTLSVVSIFYDGTNYFASIATDFQA